MEKHTFSNFKKTVKHWWISLIIGIVITALGIWCLFTPLATFAAATIVFIASFIIGGVSEIIFALINKDNIENWGWTLAMGVIDIIFAVILLNNMELAPIMLSFLIAFWIMLQSMWGIGIAFDLQPLKGSGWGWLLVLSILGILASILLLFQPQVAVLFAAYIISFGLLSYGILRIFLAFRLKSLNKYLPEE